MKHALIVAAVAVLFNLSILAPSPAAPVSSKEQQSNPKAASRQTSESGIPTTNRFLTPRMMDRKRPMNPVCEQGFKPGAPSNCHY